MNNWRIGLFCVLVMGVVCSVNAQNLLVNGDFENWTAGKLDDWSTNSAVLASLDQSALGEGKDGGYAVVLTTLAGYGAALNQNVAWSETEDQFVQLEVWLKLDASSDDDDKLFLQVEASPSNGGGSNRWTVDPASPQTNLVIKDGYKKFYVINRVQAGATNIAVRIASDTAAKFFVDKAELTVVDPYVFLNAGMNSVDEDDMPSNYVLCDYSVSLTTLTATLEGDGFWGGSDRAAEVFTAQNYGGIMSWYGVLWNSAAEPLTTQINFKIKVLPVDGSDTDTAEDFRLFMFDGGGFQGDGTTVSVPIDNQWHWISTPVTIAQNTDQKWFRIDCPAAGSDPVRFLIDDPELEATPSMEVPVDLSGFELQ